MRTLRRNADLPPSSRDAGFTLVELLVSLAVTAVLILGVLATFDLSSRVNRVQMSVADLQQSMRVAQNEVVRLARMAGRGGLPANQALLLTNNVTSGTKLVTTVAASEVLEGTDVVRVRGVISGSLFQIEYLDGNVFTAPDASGNGSVVVIDHAAGVPQDIDALQLAAKAGETLLLVTPFDTYFVVTADTTTKIDDFKGTYEGLRINFKGNTVNAGMGGVPIVSQTAVAYLGVLEEYAYYVRKDGTGESPKLARARLVPGTSTAYGDDPAQKLTNVTQDIADNIMDLQAVSTFVTAGLGLPDLRLTTLARSDRRDPGKYLGPLLPATLEDHAYSTAHPYNSDTQRRYRWRVVRSNVDMRNL
jgi:prepilin-type N-terminal cleavage/methylation domain-containing protein